VGKEIGRIERQMNYAFKESGIIQYGFSKHDAVKAARNELSKIDDRKVNSHELAKEIGIFNKATYKNIYTTIRSFCHYLDEKKTDNLQDFGRRRVEEFLKIKVEEGIKLEHYKNIEGHLTKMEAVLKIYFEKHNIEKDLKIIDRAKAYSRDYAKEHLEKGVEARSYKDSKAIIDNLHREDHKLVATIQLEAGARINEASLIDKTRLGGITEHLGREVGVIKLERGDAKGGLKRDMYLPKETYERVSAYVAENGKLHIPRGGQRDEYRAAIKEAAQETGQKYTGSHGLRHNFAQNRMVELKTEGMGHRVALTQVSIEMGHFREDITEHYLRT
jgi:integrase